MIRSDTSAVRATTSAHRRQALDVLNATYAEEKDWVDSASALFPTKDLGDESTSWIVASVDKDPAGVLRVDFDPPLEQYTEYEFDPLDGAPDLDVDAFIQNHRTAEIGPFAVLPKFRRRLRVVFWLMRVAGRETLRRNYTHYVTDIFQGEEHSPYQFHTRVLGFRPVATHETGEMDCLHRRITLVLNLKEAYERLRESRNRLYRFLTKGIDATLLHSFSA
ncbi:MAG: GNAT family N-acetyltransferase [Salinibacter sp.]